MVIHLPNKDGKAIGCGWQPTSTKALDLNPDDCRNDEGAYSKCTRCFRKHTFPTTWDSDLPIADAKTSDDSDALSSDLFSDDAEKVTASTLLGKTSLEGCM